MLSEQLITQLRARAADPKTRTDGAGAYQYAAQPDGSKTTRMSLSEVLGTGAATAETPLAGTMQKLVGGLFFDRHG